MPRPVNGLTVRQNGLQLTNYHSPDSHLDTENYFDPGFANYMKSIMRRETDQELHQTDDKEPFEELDPSYLGDLSKYGHVSNDTEFNAAINNYSATLNNHIRNPYIDRMRSTRYMRSTQARKPTM